jgi:hypothetical protein
MIDDFKRLAEVREGVHRCTFVSSFFFAMGITPHLSF